MSIMKCNIFRTYWMLVILRAVILVPLLLLTFAVSAHDSRPLSVKAQLDFDHGVAVIRYKIKNISDHTVELNDGSLPWRSVWSARVIFTYRYGRTTIPRYPAIDDIPPPWPVALKSHHEISGDLPLSRYIDNFDERSSNADIVVFWLYSATTADQRSLGDYGGWFLIPKGTKTHEKK